MKNEYEQEELLDYIKHFEVHWRLFLKRYKRYMKLQKLRNNDDLDANTYFDMLIVQIRAMCIENSKLKNNYTVQNVLKKIGREELASKIDNVLDMPFREYIIDKSTGNPITIKKVIKILADGFICHYDNFDGERDIERSFAIVIENNLRNPYYSVNLEFIISVVIDCVEQGFFNKHS